MAAAVAAPLLFATCLIGLGQCTILDCGSERDVRAYFGNDISPWYGNLRQKCRRYPLRRGLCLYLIADGSRMFVRKEVEREGRCQLVCYLCEDLPSCPLYDALANSGEMYLHIPTEHGFARLALQLQGVLVVGLVGLFLYAIIVIIYRLTFHPLAKYPGPFFAKITSWHEVYHAWKGDRHLEFWRAHERYGKFVRFSPNCLSINSDTALKKIYGFDANVRKSKFYTVFPPTKDSFNTHNSIDQKVHARKRRVLSYAFSDNAIKQMEKYMLANIRVFCEGLGARARGNPETKGWGVGQNMSDWCNYLTFDIMGELCFGKAFGMLERPDNRFPIRLLGSAAHRHLICGTNPTIHRFHLDKVLFRKIASDRERYMAYSKTQAMERMKTGSDTDHHDFFYYLLKAKDPESGAGFAIPELWGESNLLIIAGSDTTSTSLSAAFFYLVHNPDTLERVTQEIRATFGTVEDIHIGQQLSTCNYLRAVLDEAMRLSPPVGGLLPREVLPGGITIDGEHFPAGVVVGTPHYTIHHNAKYYPDPFAFLPERWIPGSTPNVTPTTVATARGAFCPFSIGPRGCIGKGMAYAELSIALARVLWTYDMRLSPDVRVGEGHPEAEFGRQRVGEFQLRDTFTSMKDGPVVEFRRRPDENKEN